ncbi:hypothetical protein GCM10009646_01010 [Streptomyces aureus]
MRVHEPGHVRVSQRVQFQPVDGGQPDQLGEQRPQRVTAVQIVRAVRGEDREPVARAARRGPLQDTPAEQKAEQVARRLVRPVEVLDDQEKRGQGR